MSITRISIQSQRNAYRKRAGRKAKAAQRRRKAYRQEHTLISKRRDWYRPEYLIEDVA